MLSQMKNKLFNKMADEMQMPLTEITNTLHIEFQGLDFVKIENCLKIIKYEPDIIIMEFPNSVVTFKGFDLEIPSFSDYGSSISGKITSVEFSGR